jgi:sensor histidine kinase YesM
MNRLEIILICVLLLSGVFNIIIFAYARSAITKLLTVSEELGDLQQMISKFSNHVRDVYNLEMFYGDETLKYLMDHAVSLNEQLEDNFEYIYSLTEEETETEEEDFDNAEAET